MTEKRRRRAVGPAGAKPTEEPLAEPREDRDRDRRDLERYQAERPPHHDPR